VSSFVGRNGDNHRASTAGRVLDDELATDGVHETPRDGEPKADACAIRVVTESLEWLKDAFTIGDGDTGSGVDDSEVQIVPNRGRFDTNRAIGR
jgi:hypothetical protein